MAKTTYIATAPDGSEHRRATDRTYTHAVLAEGPDGWKAVGFCGRPDLAEKKRADHPGSVIVECGVLGAAPVDKPRAEAAEKHTVGRLIGELLMDEAMDYTAIVARVRADFPGARTTTRSVASVAATLRKKGANVPTRKRSAG